MKNYPVVGYGSLLSHKSLKEDVKNKHFTAVIVRGYKRIFNINLNEKADILNLKKSQKDSFNGVLFRVNEKELKKLKEREDWYNFEEVICYDFLSKNKLGKSLVSVDHIISIDRKKLFPNKSYFILCREAAYHIGKEFGKIWDNTTYTSTGEKISGWIKKNPQYDTIK